MSAILQQGCVMQCPHGGTVTVTPSNTRVRVNSAFALLQNDVFTVAGCPFQIPVPGGTKPQPCVTVQWQTPARMVKIGGQTVLLETSVGLCQSA